MKISFKGFFIKNLLIFTIMAIIGGILFSTVFSKHYHPIFPILLVFALINNLLVYYIISEKNQSAIKSSQIIMLIFAIKFFSYVAITIIFFLVEKDFQVRIFYIIALFCIYIAFTIVEVDSCSKFLKSGKSNS
jgi:hypothetical protein